jgi:hypothetical protein
VQLNAFLRSYTNASVLLTYAGLLSAHDQVWMMLRHAASQLEAKYVGQVPRCISRRMTRLRLCFCKSRKVELAMGVLPSRNPEKDGLG